jgi:predicted small lipoprotein YifL
MTKLALLALCLAACGSKTPPPADPEDRPSTPEGGFQKGGDEAIESGHSGGMIAPESEDQIQRLLDRKRDSVARCLGQAVDNKELPKNAHGKVVLEIAIGTSGSATSIKVVKTDLDSKTLTDCVIHHVQEIAFPTLPRPFERSYTYGFEAD